MGSHTWVRDDSKKKGGVTHVTGVPVVVPVASKKRKLTWTRDNEATPREQVAKESSAKKQASVEDKQAKLQEIKKLIALKERQIHEKKQKSICELDNAELEFRQEEKLKKERREKLTASFADAFDIARDAIAAEIKSSKTSIVTAGDKEIQKILHATSDYSALGISPGADAAAIRKKYRQIAVTVHPDKCKHPKANEAFHRIVSAYRQLLKYVG